MSTLLKSKDVLIKNVDGEAKTFVISRVPAIPMREVMAKYPVSNIPKLGEYQASKEVMQLLMSYVAVRIGDDQREVRLVNNSLIDNHVDDGEQLLRLEYAMLEYNTNFFGKGGISNFLTNLITTHLPLIIQTVTASLPASEARNLQAKPNSKQP